MHARHSVSVKLGTLKFHAGVRLKKKMNKTEGASLRITPIWLFYPLAQQRTKCIDGSAIAPPVSGMYFTHQSAERSTVHRGHLANEVTFLLIGEKEGVFLFLLVQERSFKAEGGFEKGSVPERKLVRKLKSEWKS